MVSSESQSEKVLTRMPSLHPLPLLSRWYLSAKTSYYNIPKFKRDGMRHASVMLLCMSLLLAVLYTQYRSYIYADARVAILKAARVDDLSTLRDIDEMWPWLKDLTEHLGGETFDYIESNCGPADPNVQVVEVDGVEYQVVDPAQQTMACQDAPYVSSLESPPVLLTGNFELMLLGIFADEAKPYYPDENALSSSVKAAPVYSDTPVELSATNDFNIVKLCDSPWSSTVLEGVEFKVSSHCVLEDSFWGSAYSTLNWRGLKTEGKYSFDPSSQAIIRLNSSLNEFELVYPCYSYDSNSSIISGNPNYTLKNEDEFSSCSNVWISKGSTIRGYCLDSSGTQPSALQLYTAALTSLSTSTELLNYYFGCSRLVNFSVSELSNVYVKSDIALKETQSQTLHGLFISVDDENSFLIESYRALTLLQGHRFVGKRTRKFRLDMILRNLEKSSMYYTMLHCDIIADSNGVVGPQFEMTHVPIIQYVYGSGNYPWYFHEVVSLEAMLLLFFCLFLLRELKQATLRLKSYYHDKTKYAAKVNAEDSPGDIESPHTPSVPSEENNGDDKKADDVVENVRSSKTKFQLLLPDEGSLFHDLVDWLTIACFITAIIHRILYIYGSIKLHSQLKSREADNSVGSSLDSIVAQFDYLSNIFEQSHYVTLVVCLVGFVQFFRYLSFDERLGIVTRTMADSFADLIPVGLILTFILVAYGILGVALYGYELTAFESLGSSLTTLGLIILGEVAVYYDMAAVTKSETIVYYWSFVLLIGFVLLNMVLAVIFNVYDEAYNGIAAAKQEKKNE